MKTADTIFALSSGAPPAAIAIMRISGPAAFDILRGLSGRVPSPRRASLCSLYSPETQDILDQALVLVFPGPDTATGEDLVELHLHGGRAVVRMEDLENGADGLPPTDGLRFTLKDARVIIRPSGTEPKLKCYLQVVVPVTGAIETARKTAQAELEAVRASVAEIQVRPATAASRFPYF